MSLDLRNRIVEQAAWQFLENGIRNITMDNLAEQLGISKRTIYEQFHDKEELVCNVMDFYLKKKEENLKTIIENSNNTIEFLLSIYDTNINGIKKISPLFFKDLKKRFPEIEKKKEKSKDERINYLSELFKKGIEEGYICSHFDTKNLGILFEMELDMIFEENYINTLKENFIKTYKTMILAFLRGIVTEKGLAKIDEYILNVEKNNK